MSDGGRIAQGGGYRGEMACFRRAGRAPSGTRVGLVYQEEQFEKMQFNLFNK